MQAETYRRMRKANNGNWHAFLPVTNTLWMHYMSDILLNKKDCKLDAAQKRELRSFRYTH